MLVYLSVDVCVIGLVTAVCHFGFGQDVQTAEVYALVGVILGDLNTIVYLLHNRK